MSFKVAVVGAPGAVGREILKTLVERGFPVREATALASGRAAGQMVSLGEDQVLKTGILEKHDFGGTDLVFFAQNIAVSRLHVPRAAAAGAMVIDLSTQFCMEPDVPLVVPEVNPEKLEKARRHFHVGNLYLNRKCTGAMVGAHPFGGFNMSGTDSKAGGPDYLLQFLQAKSIAEKLSR